MRGMETTQVYGEQMEKQMTLSHDQHNKQLSHIAATGLPKGAKNTVTDKTRFAICFNTVYRRSK